MEYNLEQIRRKLAKLQTAVLSKEGSEAMFDINYIEECINDTSYVWEKLGLSPKEIEVRKQYKRIEIILLELLDEHAIISD